MGKTERIVAELKQQIVEGALPSNHRLPTRAELTEQFGVATHTLQRALRELSHDGYVVARGKLGTFVAAHPPHLHRYALTLTSHEGSPDGWNRFYAALTGQALALNKEATPKRFCIYYDIRGDEPTEDRDRLLADLRARRLAGLIATIPWMLQGTALLAAAERARTPVVCLSTGPQLPGQPVVNLDTYALVDRGLEHFQAAGRRRVAVLMSSMDEALLAHFAESAARRGLLTYPHWQHAVAPQESRAAGHLMRLLMRTDDRPDALLVTDDHLVEPATAGLLAAGADVPGGLEVVAHCNWPFPPAAAVPVCWLGFDVRGMLRTCMEIIGQANAGSAPAPVTHIAPRFESEMPFPPGPRPGRRGPSAGRTLPTSEGAPRSAPGPSTPIR